MSADPWLPWLSDLEHATDAGDGGRLLAVLEDLWRFSFHEQRALAGERWDRLFELLLRLLDDEGERVRELAYHYARIAMGAQYGPPYEDREGEERGSLVGRRTAALLPKLAPQVRASQVSLLSCVDDLRHVEELVEVAPQQVARSWIDELAGDSPVGLAARIAYLDGRTTWGSGASDVASLLAHLDHDDAMVRAYASRSLGRRYCEGEAETLPPLPELLASLTEREVERPGVAGPFFSNWYDHGIAEFGALAAVDVEEWVCTILARRRQPEPDLLPCSNGIDFFAHELFGGQAGYVRRLLDMGHERLAVEAATEVDERIDELAPLLVELGDRADDEVCRLASWYLASHFRRLHPAGEARGFVSARALDRGAEVFVNLSRLPDGGSYAYAAALFPAPGEVFDEERARGLVESVLPAPLRGELVTFGMPGDGGEPGHYVYGRTASARYSGGAMIQYRGDPLAKRWEWIRIVWHGRPGDWRP